MGRAFDNRMVQHFAACLSMGAEHGFQASLYQTHVGQI
jgi:hypothetical protein